MKNILYIDKGYNLEDIRIGEQVVFGSELKRHGYNIFFLLQKNTNKNYRDKCFFYRNKINSKPFKFDLLITLISLYKILSKNKIDIIVVRKNWDTGLAGLFVSKIYKKKYVHILSVPVWEAIIEKTKNSINIVRIISKYRSIFNYKITQMILKYSDLILPQSDSLLKDISIKFGIQKHKMMSFPMGFNSNLKVDINKVEFIKKKYKLNDFKIIIYIGAMDKRRRLSFLIKIIKLINKQNDKVKLLMVGGTKEEIKSLNKIALKEDIINNVIFTGKVKREMIVNYLSVADISISPIPPSPVYINSSPTKVIESLGVGIPVIANIEIQDQRKVITESKGGVCVPYKREAFAEQIINLLDKPNDCYKMGNSGRNYILKNRTYNIIAKNIDAALKKTWSCSH